MNMKILNYVKLKLIESFSLPKYDKVVIDDNVNISKLPWTPVRFEKFKNFLNEKFDMELNYKATLTELSKEINEKYNKRFWSSIWQPRTEDYQYSGWSIVERINKENPVAVLDVGCGYNQFKSRIKNLTGIDAYNNCADYMVDVLDYSVPNQTYDHIIAFGSINFGSYDDIELRMKKVFDLLKPGGTVYMRANPGIDHKNGYFIDIYPWDFDTAYNIAEKMNVKLVTFKVDNNDRFYIEFMKPMPV